MIIGAKHGLGAAFLGQKMTNAGASISAKHGALFGRGTAVSVPGSRGRGDLGGGASAPGNTANPIANGSRDPAPRPDGVRSMADPRPNKKAKTVESMRKNKTN